MEQIAGKSELNTFNVLSKESYNQQISKKKKLITAKKKWLIKLGYGNLWFGSLYESLKMQLLVAQPLHKVLSPVLARDTQLTGKYSLLIVAKSGSQKTKTKN